MAPPMWCFVHFDLQMCFAPQRRAIFEHLNFKNGSGNVVFCTFWLANMLFATAACHFSPVRGTATSAPAALASLLFEHQEPRFIEKTQRFATSLTFFAHVELLASDSTRMLIFLLVTWLMLIFLLVTWLLCDSAFQLYILSEVRLLNFLRLYVHMCPHQPTNTVIHEIPQLIHAELRINLRSLDVLKFQEPKQVQEGTLRNFSWEGRVLCWNIAGSDRMWWSLMCGFVLYILSWGPVKW